MPKVQPGQPNASLYSVSTVLFGNERLTALAVQDAVVIYRDIDEFIQTVRCQGYVSAVTIDRRSAKIAAASPGHIEVFDCTKTTKSFQWTGQSTIDCKEEAKTLSWGAEGEILAGNTELVLYRLKGDVAEASWTLKQANPLRMVAFSPDGSLFASVGEYDRVVKIWHRIPTPSAPDFSFVYLSNRSVIVHFQWKQPAHVEIDMDNVLFTVDVNNTVSIWAPLNSWEPHILYQRASVPIYPDTIDSIRPSIHTASALCILIDSTELTKALETLLNRMDGANSSTPTDLISGLAREAPDLCLVLNLYGNTLVLWGIDQVDCRNGKPVRTSKILERTLPHDWTNTKISYSLLWAFCVGSHGFANLWILEHTLNGSLRAFEVDIFKVLTEMDTSPIHRRIVRTGHATNIVKLSRTVDGRGLLSKGQPGESIAWRFDTSGIRQQSVLPFNGSCYSVTLLAGQYCLALYSDVLELWCSRSSSARKLHGLPVKINGKILCFFQQPRSVDDGELRKFIAITDAKESYAWGVNFSNIYRQDTAAREQLTVVLLRQGPFPAAEDIHLVSPVDPMGWRATINSESLDVYSREVLVTVSSCGHLQTWTTNLSKGKSGIAWLNLSTVQTNISEALRIQGTSERKVAMVNRTGNELTIWDTRVSRFTVHEEYRNMFPEDDFIRDLDWTSTPDCQSVLAVGFLRRVVLFCQQRYDYLNGGSTWISFMSFDMHNLTNYRISDSTWLDQGSLAVAAGPQLYVFDKTLKDMDIRGTLHLDAHNYPLDNIFDVCLRLNGPLPVYHPQFLQQLILSGKLQLVNTLLTKLQQILSDHGASDNSFDTSAISTFLDTPLSNFLENVQSGDPGGPFNSQLAFQFPSDEKFGIETEKPSSSLLDLLEKSSLPYITSNEQGHLAVIVHCMNEFEKHRRSLDINASRFFLFFRQHLLSRLVRKGLDSRVAFRDMLWAFHSHSQEILLDLVSRTYSKPMKWENAREAGVFLWIRHGEALKALMEILARNQYAQTDERNPVDCTLFYLALRKKNVLSGLWRSAGWHKEQPAMIRFLSNDFRESRWKTAASKNAYALLAKQRYEYAAAFFLLADSLKDAVNVCLRNLNDFQLAVALARVYEGDDGPVLTQIINDHILPRAAEEGDRWLASWAFWMLGDRGKSVQALILPLDSLIPVTVTRPSVIQIDDPALVVLYRQLKDKTLQTMRGAAKISPKLEFDYVLRSASLYDRLGCDLLALDLVKNWDFTTEAPPSRPVLSSRRRSTIDDISVSQFRESMNSSGAVHIPSTLKEESSLLDSFEFGF